MLRTILINGGAAALGIVAFMVVQFNLWPNLSPQIGVVIGYLAMLVALTTVFLGVKHHRDKALGGVIKFLPALGIGLAISAVASLGWVIGWEITLATSSLDYGAMVSEMMTKEAEGRGASAAELAKVGADARAFAEMYRNPVIRMGITFIEMFPVGVVISLVTAGLLRNSRLLPARQAA